MYKKKLIPAFEMYFLTLSDDIPKDTSLLNWVSIICKKREEEKNREN